MRGLQREAELRARSEARDGEEPEELTPPPQAGEEPEEPTPLEPHIRYLFKFDAEVYQVRYEDEAGKVDSSLDGAKYTYELLQHPHTQYTPIQLKKCAAKEIPPSRGDSEFDDEPSGGDSGKSPETGREQGPNRETNRSQ
jgi:hypothetical protein